MYLFRNLGYSLVLTDLICLAETEDCGLGWLRSDIHIFLKTWLFRKQLLKINIHFLNSSTFIILRKGGWFVTFFRNQLTSHQRLLFFHFKKTLQCKKKSKSSRRLRIDEKYFEKFHVIHYFLGNSMLNSNIKSALGISSLISNLKFFKTFFGDFLWY